jgi:putative endopeptidase
MTLDPDDRDASVAPGADFYRYANGGWLDANPIPPGYGSWGSFEEIERRNEQVLLDVLQHAADEPATELDRMLGDYFAAGMDLAAVEAAGTEPIRPLLDAAAAVGSHDDLVDLLPWLHSSGIDVLFGWAVTPDHEDATRNLLWLAQSGLGLPDRDAYFAEDEASAGLREAYAAHVAAQLANLGEAGGAAVTLASGVLELETRLAALHLRAEETRDRSRTLNRHDVDALDQLAPGLVLSGYLRGLGAGDVKSVNVQNPAYLAGLPTIVTGTDLAVLRAYLAFHVVRATADALPKVFDDESFAFYGRRIRGQKQQHERSKRVIGAITADMGEALSQRYVVAAFPPEAKQRALQMVRAIVDEMRRSLDSRSWMGDETRARAIGKLDAMRVKIGYPDRWRDWSGLHVTRTSYAANRLDAARFERHRQLAKLADPVDRDEWEMPPHVVNAYYHPTRNEIVFPAGILQPPLFDSEADDAMNFGGIGAVIGHEITHGFDDQGRRFDSDGTFRDWWTVEDERRFTALADRLVAQFDAYRVLGDVRVNGRLTLGENIADLGGLALAQRAHARLAAASPPVDGVTPAQRFFLAYATLWRANVSDELQRTLAQMDPHSPRHLRVRGPLANLDSFQQAFGLPDDAPMVRPPEERIEIW